MDASTNREFAPSAARADLPRDSLAMLVLQVLAAGPLHDFDVTQRLQQIAGDLFRLPRETLYPTLHRLEGHGLLAAAWKPLAGGREAKCYRLTAAGRARLKGAAGWDRGWDAGQDM